MKVMLVVGARPNFMKAAPIISAIREHNVCRPSSPIEHVLVHTGQHYDPIMSGAFFADLNLPAPDVHLGAGPGSHATQTAHIMCTFEQVLVKEKPDVLIVVGDVNSTLGTALVAAKITFDPKGARPLIAHVEAGLRSFDRTMPEELNRILTDQLADFLFVTEESAVRNLRREGIPDEKVHFVGNTMIDSLLAFRDRADNSRVIDELNLRELPAGDVRRYALLTLHRPANVDNVDSFLDILEGLRDLKEACPVIFPVHPRTRKRIGEFGFQPYFDANGPGDAPERNLNQRKSGICLTDPLGYLDFLCLMKHAALVITDSGGIQEETTCLGVPCVTVRNNTERPVTIEKGTNVLAGIESAGIRAAIQRQLCAPRTAAIPEKWDGKSAHRIIETICRVCAADSALEVSADEPILF